MKSHYIVCNWLYFESLNQAQLYKCDKGTTGADFFEIGVCIYSISGIWIKVGALLVKRHLYSHLYHTKVIKVLPVKTSLKSESESIPFPGFGLRSVSFKLRDIHIPIYIFHPRRAPILNWDENIIQILCKASFLFSKIPPGCWRGWTIYG